MKELEVKFAKKCNQKYTLANPFIPRIKWLYKSRFSLVKNKVEDMYPIQNFERNPNPGS